MRSSVLVVDAEPIIRSLVQLGLEREGFEVWLAANSLEAVQLYEKYSKDIAVVLLEVSKVNLDGFQTLEELRKVDPTIVACFMTTETEGAYETTELLRYGVAQVISKPFLLRDLVQVLRQLLI